jgi:hypothetical protein
MSSIVQQEKENDVETIEAIAQPVYNPPKATVKSQRNIFRFAGEKPAAINLEHVTQINLESKKITFQFYNTAMYVDLADDAAALSAFETILNIWAGERE